jgi:hypothetical protein
MFKTFQNVSLKYLEQNLSFSHLVQILTNLHASLQYGYRKAGVWFGTKPQPELWINVISCMTKPNKIHTKL